MIYVIIIFAIIGLIFAYISFDVKQNLKAADNVIKSTQEYYDAETEYLNLAYNKNFREEVLVPWIIGFYRNLLSNTEGIKKEFTHGDKKIEFLFNKKGLIPGAKVYMRKENGKILGNMYGEFRFANEVYFKTKEINSSSNNINAGQLLEDISDNIEEYLTKHKDDRVHIFDNYDRIKVYSDQGKYKICVNDESQEIIGNIGADRKVVLVGLNKNGLPINLEFEGKKDTSMNYINGVFFIEGDLIIKESVSIFGMVVIKDGNIIIDEGKKLIIDGLLISDKVMEDASITVKHNTEAICDYGTYLPGFIEVDLVALKQLN